jgi:hypothetical protein
MALAVYVCFSVVAGRDALGKRLFWAVLAFGAWAAVGYIFITIVVSMLHLDSTVERQPQALFFSAAYIAPGLLGSWLTIRILGKFEQKKRSGGNSASSST